MARDSSPSGSGSSGGLINQPVEVQLLAKLAALRQPHVSFVADLMATRSHQLNIPAEDIRTVLKQMHPDQSIADDAKKFAKTLLEDTGNALLKDPSLWNKVPASLRKIADVHDVHVQKVMDNTDEPNVLTKVLGKRKERLQEGDYTLQHAGLSMHSNTAVRLSATLEYICDKLMELAGNAAKDIRKTRITVYFIRLAIANNRELTELFELLEVPTGASLCMRLTPGMPGYPTMRKDGSHPPPFHAALCLKAKQLQKRGIDGKMYVTTGKRWVAIKEDEEQDERRGRRGEEEQDEEENDEKWAKTLKRAQEDAESTDEEDAEEDEEEEEQEEEQEEEEEEQEEEDEEQEEEDEEQEEDEEEKEDEQEEEQEEDEEEKEDEEEGLNDDDDDDDDNYGPRVWKDGDAAQIDKFDDKGKQPMRDMCCNLLGVANLSNSNLTTANDEKWTKTLTRAQEWTDALKKTIDEVKDAFEEGRDDSFHSASQFRRGLSGAVLSTSAFESWLKAKKGKNIAKMEASNAHTLPNVLYLALAAAIAWQKGAEYLQEAYNTLETEAESSFENETDASQGRGARLEERKDELDGLLNHDQDMEMETVESAIREYTGRDVIDALENIEPQ